MTTETRAKIIEECKGYEDGEFDLYCAEAGWQDWMQDYAEGYEDDECLGENTLRQIGKEQQECWNIAHPEDNVRKF